MLFMFQQKKNKKRNIKKIKKNGLKNYLDATKSKK